MANKMYIPWIVFFFGIFSVPTSFGQPDGHPPRELLKGYTSYTHTFEAPSCWKRTYQLQDGLVVQQENRCRGKLRYRVQFRYNDYGNKIEEIVTYDANRGRISDTSEIKLTYHNSHLVRKEGFGLVEVFSDFTTDGQPRRLERDDAYDLWPKEVHFEYNAHGKMTKKVTYHSYTDLDDTTIDEKATIHFTYNPQGDVIAIHREYEPEQDFPILMSGGPHLYEYEYFRYKYNENGLWTRKYKTVNGEERLVAQRKYK